MKRITKTRDFSIESILANKCESIQNSQDEIKRQLGVCKNYETVQGKECRESDIKTVTKNALIKETSVINLKNYFEEECAVNDQRINLELRKLHNCDINVQSKSEIAEGKNKVICKYNSQKFLDSYCSVSVDEENNKCNQCERKVQTYIINNFYEVLNNVNKCDTSSKSTVTAEFEDRHSGNDKTIKSSVQEEGDLNDINAMKTINHVQDKFIVNSKIFRPDESNYEQMNENGYREFFTLSKEYRGKFNKEQKKPMRQDQSYKLHNKHIKSQNKNSSDVPRNQHKNLRISLYRNLERTETDHFIREEQHKEELEFYITEAQEKETTEDTKQFEWLRYTRYKPPKIPRKSTIGKNKRKPSFYPRIPFSTFQLDFLERRFQNSAYLSKNDVLEISGILKLPPNRIKVWFQNRRARQRREFDSTCMQEKT